VQELEQQAAQIREDMPPCECHHFVRVCQQHLQGLVQALRSATPPV